MLSVSFEFIIDWLVLFHAKDTEFILNSDIFQTRGKSKNVWRPRQIFSHSVSIFIPVHSEEFYKHKIFYGISDTIIDHLKELIGKFALILHIKYNKFKGSI